MIISTKYLITGDGKTVLTDKAVYIGEDGKIGKIAPKEELLKEFPQEEVKEYGDATLLPGLMDMHAHLAYGYSQPDSFNYGAQLIMLYALQHAQSAFERGITTVRDMSSAHGVCKNLKLAEKKGFIVIPRIVHTDTGICMTGGHAWDEVEEADGPWAIRKEIRKQVRDGAEWVKILTTNREPYPELTQEELDAAVDECHRRGIKCGVHAGTNPGIQMCIDAGFDTIEHGTFMTLDHAKQKKVLPGHRLSWHILISMNCARKISRRMAMHRSVIRSCKKRWKIMNSLNRHTKRTGIILKNFMIRV